MLPASFQEWLRPRAHHSLLRRWLRYLAILVIPWAVVALLRRELDLASLASFAFLYALGDHSYFRIHKGSEKDYPWGGDQRF